MKRGSVSVAVVGIALATGTLVGCGEPPPRPRPAEIPLAEFRPGEGAPSPPAATSEPAPSVERDKDKDRDKDRDVAASAAATGGDDESKPGGDSSPKANADAKPGVATQLDLKGGFLGATFGSTPKAYRGLVLVDKRGDSLTYRAAAKTYGGFPLRDVVFIFRKSKLATIQYALKRSEDCRPMRETLIRELGAPQRAVNDASVWRGEKLAMRFVITGSGACSGTMLSKEHSAREYDSL